MTTHILSKTHGLIKRNTAQDMCHKHFSSMLCFSSMRKIQLTILHSVSSLVRNEIQVKKLLSVASSKPVCFKKQKDRFKNGLLSWPFCGKKVAQTSHNRQLTPVSHSNSRQLSPLPGMRWQRDFTFHLSAQQSTRTFLTSSVILATSSPTQNVSPELVTDVTVPISPENGLVASMTTAGTSVESGQDEIANSVAETATSASLLFPDFPTIQAAELTIQKLHEITGLPWWTTITLTAVALRVILIMPLSVYALHNAEKLSRLQPEIIEISKRLKQEVSMAMHQFKWDEKKAKDEYIKNMKRLLKDLHVKNNCHPMKNTVSFWLQFPVWISISYSLRNMTSRAVNPNLDHHEDCKTLTDQGALWFPDLTLTDSTWILPGLMGFVTLFNIEMTHLKIGEDTKYRKRLTLFLRCLALLFIPISSTMPSAMVFYWVNSGFLAAAQNMLHDYSPFRRLVGLGPSQTESSSPAKALMNKAKSKYLNR